MANPLDNMEEFRIENGNAMDLQTAALCSIAISMKRIADAFNTPNEYGEVGAANLARAIKQGLGNG